MFKMMSFIVMRAFVASGQAPGSIFFTQAQAFIDLSDRRNDRRVLENF
jgi:hypothetical protein